MRIHLIAIGGAVMHNLALVLKKLGHRVSGSDDEIFEPAYSRLKQSDLLPAYTGWNPEIITRNIDIVILGMHAKKDNTELKKALDLRLKIRSFPEFMYENTKDKQRIVVAGSHGKTTTTAMIMHVLKQHNYSFDYLVGSSIEGFETMVGLKDSSNIAVFEGDEYFTSTMDRIPKFMWYKPNILVITGIAWDHINVYPTFKVYKDQFQYLVDSLNPEDTLIYYKRDEILNEIVSNTTNKAKTIAYSEIPAIIEHGATKLWIGESHIPIQMFGSHNLQNMAGAREVCRQIGISDKMFYRSISGFKGTAKRLQKIYETDSGRVFLDFAHSPSKVKATIEAVKQQYPEQQLVACLELHTFSSLTKDFLKEYRHCMKAAEIKCIYYSKHTMAQKQLTEISEKDIQDGFNDNEIKVFTEPDILTAHLLKISTKNTSFLFMSSGNFSGLNLLKIAPLILTYKKLKWI